MSLNEIRLRDVTDVELVDSPPLLSRADPHNLPFYSTARSIEARAFCGFNFELETVMTYRLLMDNTDREKEEQGLPVWMRRRGRRWCGGCGWCRRGGHRRQPGETG
ncbi:hypothetical protein L1987_21030 [Smallanthus sonchifolius]|uniref:Uncharacterized protein n=1 Tax=Smallanthus sonchifolius TaxID=185202 RepID=A0ACB9ITQ7_9ASTR|nr:hypothetical protein L1987_21030 [Smallanthus sonchifolius]